MLATVLGHHYPSSRLAAKLKLSSGSPLLTASFLALLLFAGGCGQQAGIVAKVGGKKITAVEFKEEMIRRYRSEDFAAQRNLDERKGVLKNLIEQKMKIQDAYRLGLDKDSTVQQAAEDIRQQAAIQELYKVEIMDRVIPASEAKSYYDRLGEEIKASHILIKAPMDTSSAALAPAKAKIDSIYQLAVSGVPFDSLARQNSDDVTTAQNGGDLGFFTWGRMVDEFQDSAFAMKVGQISHPVKSSYGYHIIKLFERRPNPNRKSFAEEQENINMMLRRKYQKQLQKAAEDYLTRLKEKNKLTFNYGNIQKVLDKVSDPSVPRNNDYFSNFSAEEKQWVVASMKGDTITVADLQAEIAKTGNPPQWRDQKAITTMVERIVVPKFLADRAKQKGLYNSKSVKGQYESTLETRMLQEVENKQVQDKLQLADSLLLAYYQSHLNEFKSDSTVEVQEIYITVDAAKGKDLAFAQRIANRAKRGEDFTKLVHKYTDRKSSLARDGRIGPITSRQYGEMGKAAFRLNINEISDPISMGGRAYSIIKLVDKTPPRVKTFEEAKPQVERQLRMQQSDSLRTAWMDDLQKRYPAKIFDDRLMAVLPYKAPAADTTKTKTPGVKTPNPKIQQVTPPSHVTQPEKVKK